MTSTSEALKEVFTAGRPLVKQWLETAEQIAALREVATAHGLDWSQVKALLKATVQDELDDSGEGKRVRRIVDRAESASAYADMLGLANMNENNFSAQSQPSVASQAVERSAGDGPSQQTPPAAPIQEQAPEIGSRGAGEPLTDETEDGVSRDAFGKHALKSSDLAHSFEHRSSSPASNMTDQAAGVEPRIPPAADLSMDIPAFLRRSKQMETA